MKWERAGCLRNSKKFDVGYAEGLFSGRMNRKVNLNWHIESPPF